MAKSKRSSKSDAPATRPFPWKCIACRRPTVVQAVVPYTTTIEHDGRSYFVTVPDLRTPRCASCGEMLLDDAANQRINDAFRQQLGVLMPEQIRANREALGLTQREMASRLAIGEATLSRWETGGQIQQRAFDRLLRLFFGSEEARKAIGDLDASGDFGATVNPKVNRRNGRQIAGPNSVPSGRTDDPRRAADLARLAEALDSLPKGKRQSVLDQLHGLVELIRPQSRRPKAG